MLACSSTIVICVPTPLDEDHRPDLSAVEGATRAVAENLTEGTLVVLESTTWPGTTDEVARPILEKSGLVAGADFHLAFSPERIDPGNPKFGLRNTPKVVGGYTSACRDRATEFYARFVERVVPVSGTREAEMAKLLENTYRHVNIALVNEMAIFCDELGVNLWESIEAASTKPFGFQKFLPGPGVGGHCIPVDPSYLSYAVRKLGFPFRFVELAQEINERMPSYVVTRVQRLLNRDKKAGQRLEGAAARGDATSPTSPTSGRRPRYRSPRRSWSSARSSATPTPTSRSGRSRAARCPARKTSRPPSGRQTSRCCSSSTRCSTWSWSNGRPTWCWTPGACWRPANASSGCKGARRVHVLVMTVVHHPEDARILHRQIRALVDAGHEVTYAAPYSARGVVPRSWVNGVDLPRAAERRRIAAVRAARKVFKSMRGKVDMVLIHDPELLFAVAGVRHRPTVVWDVHEDTPATLSLKPWLPSFLRPPTRFMARMLESWAERNFHLLLAETAYAGRFREAHLVVPNETWVPDTVSPPGDDRRGLPGLAVRRPGACARPSRSAACCGPTGWSSSSSGTPTRRSRRMLAAAVEEGALEWRDFMPNDEALKRLDGALAGLSLLHDEPNYRHSMPTKIVEYMAHGIPVITTPSPRAVELIERYRSGVVVPWSDPQAVAQGRAGPARQHRGAPQRRRPGLRRRPGQPPLAQLRAPVRLPARSLDRRQAVVCPYVDPDEVTVCAGLLCSLGSRSSGAWPPW